MSTTDQRRDGLLVSILAAIVCLGGPLGCATPPSPPLVRLRPLNPAGVSWISGRAAVRSEQAGIRVGTAFEERYDTVLGLRVEIQNISDRPIEVGPDSFSYVTCTAETFTACDASRPVVDPDDASLMADARPSGGGARPDPQPNYEPLLLEEQRQKWSRMALRRTTVPPGSGVGGLVYVAINDKAQSVWLQVRAGGRYFAIGFRQIIAPVALEDAKKLPVL